MSSDRLDPPTLTLTDEGDLVDGQIIVSPLTVPPSEAVVTSSAGGVGTMEVITGFGLSVAVDDQAVSSVNTPTIIDVLANDTYEGESIVFGPTVVVEIVTPPANGTAEVNLDGTITYTPDLDFLGEDSFTYTVTVDLLTSDPALVSITVIDNIESVTLEAEDAVLGGGTTVLAVHPGYTGTGFVSFPLPTLSGQFIGWTYTAPIDGEYDLEFRYALISGNRPLQLEVNGAVVNASLGFPASGAWTTWRTMTTTVTLVSGVNTIRVTSIGSRGANIDSLTINFFIPEVSEIFEAEDAALDPGVNILTVHPGFTGTGFTDYTAATGQSIEWTVNVVDAGAYTLEFRYALAAGNRPLQIDVNDVQVNPSLAFPRRPGRTGTRCP